MECRGQKDRRGQVGFPAVPSKIGRDSSPGCVLWFEMVLDASDLGPTGLLGEYARSI